MGKKIVVIGSGPGGLTSAMILASKGYDVEVFEKQTYVGGRNSHISLDGFTFDLGPTFLMMKNVVEEIFQMSGRNVYDYMEIKSIDPLYRLVFPGGREFLPTSDKNKMKEQIERLFPGNYEGYLKYLEHEKEKYDHVIPCLQIPYSSPKHYLRKKFLRAIPWLSPFITLYDYLGKYFDNDELKISFTFQAKYLGMSPWKCPGTFSIISFIEHNMGIHHPIGGLNQITKSMKKVLEEEGGKIHFGTGVREVVVKGRKAVGVKLENGDEVPADDVVINADFAYAMTHIIRKENIRKYTPEDLEKRGYSCSTFMLYLGVDKFYNIPHHNVIFSDDYKKNVKEIAETFTLPEDPSFYIQNACATDPGLAPEGMSTIYVLVPVPNNKSRIDWKSAKAGFREKVLNLMEKKAGLSDIRKHIVVEKVVTPEEWENEKYIFKGATFNLAHNVMQMLYFRPHNEFEEFKNCYLAGGGTHPGSGLPTIIESGRISAELVMQRNK